MSLILCYHNPQFGVVCSDSRVSRRTSNVESEAVPGEAACKFIVLRPDLILAGSSSVNCYLDYCIFDATRRYVEAFPQSSFDEIAKRIVSDSLKCMSAFGLDDRPDAFLNMNLMGFDPSQDRVRNRAFAFNGADFETSEYQSGTCVSGVAGPDELCEERLLKLMGDERSDEVVRRAMILLAREIETKYPQVVGPPYSFAAVKTPSNAHFTKHFLNKHLGNLPDDVASDRRAATLNEKTGGARGFSALDANSQIASTFKLKPANLSSTFTATNPLSQSGTTTAINVAAFTLQWGSGAVNYNSGSVDPGAYGTWYIYFDDLTFAGGAVTYQATSNKNILYQNDARIYVGQITTASGGGGAGSGGGGGCFTGDVEILTPEGLRRFDSLPHGEEFEILNNTGTHRATLIIHADYQDDMVDLGGCRLVTVGHLFRAGDYLHPVWRPASKHFPELPRVKYRGTVYNLHVLSDDTADHHYILWNGEVAHNVKLLL